MFTPASFMIVLCFVVRVVERPSALHDDIIMISNTRALFFYIRDTVQTMCPHLDIANAPTHFCRASMSTQQALLP